MSEPTASAQQRPAEKCPYLGCTLDPGRHQHHGSETAHRTDPQVADEPAAQRLLRSLDYRLSPGVEPLTPQQVAVVLHALADHTALEAARVWSRPADGYWPTSTSIGRWLHAVADAVEQYP